MDSLKDKMGRKIRLVTKWVAIVIILAIIAYAGVMLYKVVAEHPRERDPIFNIILVLCLLTWWNTYKLRNKP